MNGVKDVYFPKTKPELIHVPNFKFLTISGEENPKSKMISKCFSVLYVVSYAIKKLRNI